ncbi:phosphate/phosphite/phosphonate ABC transporter substrate-binding protein [Marinobacterium marinum]|uniref:PhnD/SsuA/transferrin family substrate-binding protein n=1 Tax=Marinobacterium marinum TaxID=2756129 RepID=A0A7W2ACX3_9GAMM|nr:PhnD/SsuA/transferrin family substrate-binding protein [Marinobacterium marinum]MBA4502964.1 PhnD/SsuA/transferrin family substrate-binding protein [Marinobacterium marinum]
MNSPSLFSLVFTRMLLCCLLLTSGHASAKTLVLAQIGDRPKKDFRQLRPMADAMVQVLAPFGYDQADVQIYPDRPQLENAIREGRVHWITETPLTAARLYQQQLATPIARKRKRRQHAYQSLIYVRADSPIQTLSDLTGQLIALEHRNSFSSYFLPLMALRDAGLSSVHLETPRQAVPADKVGYAFSRNERNNLLWVDKGIAAAGALNDGDWQTPGRLPAKLLQNMRIIHHSALYPRAFELLTDNLEPEARQALQQALLALDPSKDSQLLMQYENSSHITPLGPHDLQQLRSLDVETLP